MISERRERVKWCVCGLRDKEGKEGRKEIVCVCVFVFEKNERERE